MRFFTSCGNRIIKFVFSRLYVEVVGNSFVQCISYHNCCVYLECSMLRHYSACIGSNRPTATATDSFVWGPHILGKVNTILGKVNTRKACGPDHITNKIIRYLLPTLHIIIQDLTNICVFHGYHPRAWKRVWALMIHKPSKRRSDPCSYSPISLLCCLSKVFEAIMTKRLMSWAENIDQLPTEQSGFRKHHSTNDKLFELTQAVCQAQRLSTCVGTVFLDIEKAFDRVWHNGLHYGLLPLCCSDGFPAF